MPVQKPKSLRKRRSKECCPKHVIEPIQIERAASIVFADQKGRTDLLLRSVQNVEEGPDANRI